MSVELHAGCPEASALAAFVEGALDESARKEIGRHVADCPECPGVIAETMRFLDETDSGAGHRRWWWIAAAVATIALSIPAVLRLSASRDPLRGVRQIAAESPTRNVEGRLAGFAYAPFPLSRAAASRHQDSLAFRAEADRVVRSDHARGVALLLAGDPLSAIGLLRAAAQHPEGGADVWNDLAAAYLASGAVGDRADLHRALAAADRAAALDPTLAAAHFNRGIAMENLGRPADAIAAYDRAISLDPQSGWAVEAAMRVTRLQQ